MGRTKTNDSAHAGCAESWMINSASPMDGRTDQALPADFIGRV
jgi:hypothetical protein